LAESPGGCQGSQILVKPFGQVGREAVEAVVRALRVEPVDPLQRLGFDVVGVTPGALPADELVVERADGGLGQRSRRHRRPSRRRGRYPRRAAAG